MAASAAIALATALGPKVLDVVSEWITDADQAQAAADKITSEVVSNAKELSLAQVELNKIEAGSRSILVAGWRPFIGWIGGLALAVNYLVIPLVNSLLVWVAESQESVKTIALMDIGPLLTLLGLMLGFGGFRSWEKKQGLTK